jgi:hypothetical protein
VSEIGRERVYTLDSRLLTSMSRSGVTFGYGRIDWEKRFMGRRREKAILASQVGEENMIDSQ